MLMDALQDFREWMKRHGFSGVLVFGSDLAKKFTGVSYGAYFITQRRQVIILPSIGRVSGLSFGELREWSLCIYSPYGVDDLAMYILTSVIQDAPSSSPILAADPAIPVRLFERLTRLSQAPTALTVRLIRPIDEKDLEIRYPYPPP